MRARARRRRAEVTRSRPERGFRKGAALLLTGDAPPVPLRREGRNVHATQFHPQGDAEGFTLRIHTYRDHGSFPSETAEALITAVAAADAPYGRELLRRFVLRYPERS